MGISVATKSFDHDPSKSNVHSIKSSVEEEKLHGSLGGIDRGSHDQKLERVGESFMHTHNSLMPGVWSINNEEVALRSNGVYVGLIDLCFIYML